MKKILIIALTFFLSINSVVAQKLDFWLDAGLKIQTGFTALYNANATTLNNSDPVMENHQQWDYTLASGTKYGAKIGINFNYTGVSFDFMRGTHRGKFQEVDLENGGTKRDDEITITSTDIYMLFRNAKHKGYIELGPKLSLINNVKDNQDPSTPNLKDSYETKNFAAVLGFGTYILGPPDGRFSGILGFRLEYGFQDVVNASGRSNEGGSSRVPVNYGGPAASTNPIFAGIVFEFNWGIGGVGQARCGERSKFIWF